MSVVAVSENMGSLGIEVGHTLAASLGYEFAERDIISKAVDRFGEDVARLSHAVEERPSLVDRLNTAQRRFAQYVAATIQEMAARDDIVLVGLASAIILAGMPHTLRARVTAPEERRAQRVAQAQRLEPMDALERVRQSDRERDSRVRFLYHADLENPLVYDLVINTDRLDVEEGARLVQQALQHPRFRSTEASRLVMRDLSLVAQARAVLVANPVTRARSISVDCADGVVSLGGRVEEWSVRSAAEQALARVPGIREIRFLSFAAIDGPGSEEGRRDLHGEAHRWGGHGPSR
jgi:cytidylate kinase